MSARMTRMAAVSACLVLLAGTVVLAQGHGQGDPHAGMRMPGMDRGGLGPIMGLLHELDLSEEQGDRLRATVHEHMGGKLGKLQQQAMQARRQLERLVHDPKSEEQAILDAAQQVGLNGEQLALERHKLTLAINEILTEEQRAQLQEMLDKNPMQRRARPFHSGG